MDLFKFNLKFLKIYFMNFLMITLSYLLNSKTVFEVFYCTLFSSYYQI